MKYFLIIHLLFLSHFSHSQEKGKQHFIENREMGVISVLKKTKLSKAVKFEGIRAEVAIGRIFAEASKSNDKLVEVYFLSRVSEKGASSYPSNKKINLELRDGADAYTALSYVMTQAIWHWQLVGGKIFIVPWGSSEDGWSIGEANPPKPEEPENIQE